MKKGGIFNASLIPPPERVRTRGEKEAKMNIILNGKLTKDPEIKYFESGKMKANFSIAVNLYDAKTKEQVGHFFNCEAWEKLAELIAEKFKKGQQICVDGRYKFETYKKDGQDKVKNVFVVNGLHYTVTFAVVGGTVEKEEKRFTTNNKQIQYIKLAEYPNVTIMNKNDKTAVVCNNYYTFYGYLSNADNKLLLDAKEVFIDTTGRETGLITPIVKFAEEEMPLDEEIPF